jgi:hypothetical protein
MKKCPTCEKTFDDSMRFCQTDGTPLVEVIEEAPQDPFKTMVAPPDEIASAIPPPDDPFKTMVGGSMPKPESGDLLQLPEEFDPMKTSVVSQEEMREQLGASNRPEDSFPSPAPPSSSPFEDADSPLEIDSVPPSPPNDVPKFSEPSLDPPDLGGMSSSKSSSSPGSAPKNEPFSFDSTPPPSEPPAQPDTPFSNSPFDRQDNAPIPSPFGDAPKPFDQPASQRFQEPEPPPTVLGGNPFNQPEQFNQPPSFDAPVSLGKQEPANQSFNPPAQQNDWAPPPAPVSDWQNQSIGQNTPFQPPVAAGGPNKSLALASLICGALSLLGCIGLFVPLLNYVCIGVLPLLALAAIVMGILAVLRVKKQPEKYTGKGLAIGGILTGVLSLLSLLGIIILAVLLVANMNN